MTASHPFAGAARAFIAAAMPQGDREFGVEGPLVTLIEHRGEEITRQRFYSPEEAEQLAGALLNAVQALEAGKAWNRQLGKPARRPHRLIDRSHRTMAEVMASEEPVFVGMDLASGPEVAVETTIEGGEIVAITEVRADVQHKCRLCGQWRVSRCSYKTCPLPGEAHG